MIYKHIGPIEVYTLGCDKTWMGNFRMRIDNLTFNMF